jgi:hypothetical protein
VITITATIIALSARPFPDGHYIGLKPAYAVISWKANAVEVAIALGLAALFRIFSFSLHVPGGEKTASGHLSPT